MAKNLKINVKNAQLAKALNLSKAKKTSIRKKKTDEEAAAPTHEEAINPPTAREEVRPPVAAQPPVQEPTPPPPAPPEPKEERQPPVSPDRDEEPRQSPPPFQERRPAAPSHHTPSSHYRPAERPPYRSSAPQSGGYRPPYRPDNRGPDNRGYPQSAGGPQQRSYPPAGAGGQQPYSPRPGGYPPRAAAPGGYQPPYRRPYSPSAPGSPDRRGPPYPPRPAYGAPRYGRPPEPRAVPPKDLPPGATPHKKAVKSFQTDDSRKPGVKDARDVKAPRKQFGGGFDARDRQGLRADQEEQTWRKRRPVQKFRPIQQEEIIRPKTLKVRVPITIKDLASEMKLKSSQLIAKLFMKGVILTLNDFLDDETTIQLLGQDFDCEITIDRTEEVRLKITDRTIKQEIQDIPANDLIFRPPVVAFMGHVDHGKTSLIDTIRKSDLADGEAGAITQHIGAFKCHTDSGDLTILDTPGHEAFSAMRSRGADVTDIVVLVIAGDEGIRTQTVEALEQAQDANVPIVVALNKCDKPNFDADNVYRQLSERNLLPEAWGGQTITVNCSAASGAGVKELLEMLALQAEILELRANPNARARGTVIESEMHKGLGPVATMLVQNGTLRLGDAIVFAQHYARVKTMHDEHGRELTEAPPSTPVKITGLSGLPEAGSEFIVVKNEKEAMEIAEKRSEGQRHAMQQLSKRSGLENFLQEKAGGIQKKTLNLILRADVQGSVEALKTSLMKIGSKKVDVNIISSAVGEISESDIQLAHASKATIIGFHTQIESRAESLIKENKVVVKMHDIIYHAVDDVKAIMLTLLDKIAQETDIGEAEVKAVFKSSHLGIIAGCMVTSGTMKRSAHVRQVRNGQLVWKGPISSLKREKEDVREASKGYECGILLQNNNDVRAGDVLQAFEITYLQQDL